MRVRPNALEAFLSRIIILYIPRARLEQITSRYSLVISLPASVCCFFFFFLPFLYFFNLCTLSFRYCSARLLLRATGILKWPPWDVIIHTSHIDESQNLASRIEHCTHIYFMFCELFRVFFECMCVCESVVVSFQHINSFIFRRERRRVESQYTRSAFNLTPATKWRAGGKKKKGCIKQYHNHALGQTIKSGKNKRKNR